MWKILNIRYIKNKTEEKKPKVTLEQENHKPEPPIYEPVASLAIQTVCSTLLSSIHSYCQQLESPEISCTSSILPFLLELWQSSLTI